MAVVRVPVTSDVLKWAVERSGIGSDRLYRLFPNWDAWIEGAKHPTLKQVEGVARATHTPVGFFYLPEPARIDMPIPDFRRMAGEERGAPSPDLLDVIHASQLRQAWYRDHVRSESTAPLPFVGSLTTDDGAVEAAAKIRASLDLSADERRSVHTLLRHVASASREDRRCGGAGVRNRNRGQRHSQNTRSG